MFSIVHHVQVYYVKFKKENLPVEESFEQLFEQTLEYQ